MQATIVCVKLLESIHGVYAAMIFPIETLPIGFPFIFGSILRSAQFCLSDCLFSYLIYVECESSRLKLNIEITNKQIVSTINHHRSLPTHVRRSHETLFRDYNRIESTALNSSMRKLHSKLLLFPSIVSDAYARSNGLLTIRERVDCTTRRNTQANTHRTEK